MVGILGLSIVAAASMEFLVRFIDGKKKESEDGDGSDQVLDGAERRERRGQRGFGKGKGKGRRDEV